MPESPDIYRYANYLQQNISNYEIIGVQGPMSHYLRNFTFPLKIYKIVSIGKKLFIILENSENSIEIHLGLTGSIVLDAFSFDEINLTMDLEDPSTKQKRVLVLKNLGSIGHVLPILKMKIIQLKKSCVDPSDPNCTLESIEKVVRKNALKRMKVVNFLVKQDELVGIGNYLCCEILYDAGISPYRTMKTLTVEEDNKLIKSILEVTQNFVKTPNCHKIYQRKKDEFDNEVVGDNVVRKGKTTFWVPTLQK